MEKSKTFGKYEEELIKLYQSSPKLFASAVEKLKKKHSEPRRVGND